MKKPKLVHVTWIDSCSPQRKWVDRDAMSEYALSECYSVGWLMYSHKDRIVICATTSDGNDCGDWTAIPRACIVKISDLASMTRIKRKK